MTDTGNAQDPASTLSDSPSTSAVSDDRGLQRSDEGRMLTGVCAGLGRYAGIDPVLFRVGFAILVLGSGIGIMLYIAAFLLMRETNGGPGYLEQWTRRDFDSETVLTLLTALFALGLIINVSSGGIGTGTVVVGMLFAIVLLAAHARGVGLLAMARSLPDRLRGRRGSQPPTKPATAFAPAPNPGRSPVAEPYPAAHTAPHRDAPTTAGPHPAAAQQQTEPEFTTPHASPLPGPDPGDEPDPNSGPGPRPDPGPNSGPGPRPDPGPNSGPGPRPGPRPSPGPATPSRSVPSYPYRSKPSFDSSREPFSPYGPYQPLDPGKRQQSYSAHSPSGYGAPASTASLPRRPRSFIGGITLCLAMIVGGIIVAIQSPSGSVNMTVVGGAALIVIGTGLLVAAWFGRGSVLVAAGTIVSIALIAGSTLSGMPKKFGSYNWEPTTLSEVSRNYSVGVGEGTLDLSELLFPPGSRTVFDASVSVGEINVILPPTTRVEVNGYTKLGDVKIDHMVEGGADIRHNKVLEPEVDPKGDVATIVLNITAGLGDVEVRRAA